ncbi:MAG: hypothetical protein ACI8TQ_003285, partial [Planctomycetota bacterium]
PRQVNPTGHFQKAVTVRGEKFALNEAM